MSQRQTGKQRSQRIQIDYYRHRGGLHRLKWICAAIGLFGAVAYAGFAFTGIGQSQVSTGTISIAHASFENDCSKCHQGFLPVASDAFRIDASASLTHIESACQSCHRVGNHFRSHLNDPSKAIDQNCSACHREHEGRAVDLASIGNEKCAQCHANLSDVCAASHQPTILNQISRFTPEGHGDFQSLLGGDPGKVKFDHRQHMLPGQVESGQRGAKTLAMLTASDRDRYRKGDQVDSAYVTLTCADCHQLDGNPDATMSLSGDNELGRYMSPVAFDQHCAACHALNPPGRTEETLPLPHAAPWAEIDLLLGAKMTGARHADVLDSQAEKINVAPAPGTGVTLAVPSSSVGSAAIDSARQSIASQCLTCHTQDDISDESISEARSGRSPSLIPARWLRRGLFDHASHHYVNCRYCHSATDSTASQRIGHVPNDHEHVMIAGIESCVGCHRDASTATKDSIASEIQTALTGTGPTWASDSCTTCHRYHTDFDQTDMPHTDMPQADLPMKGVSQ